MWKSQGERSGLYGGCWSVSQPNLWNVSLTKLAVWIRAFSCKRLISSDNIPRRFDFMASRRNLNHQETNHTSLLFFVYLHFQCLTNTLYTTHTSKAIEKQLCGLVRFHYACLLPYRWLYRYVTTVLPYFAIMFFMRVFGFHLTDPYMSVCCQVATALHVVFWWCLKSKFRTRLWLTSRRKRRMSPSIFYSSYIWTSMKSRSPNVCILSFSFVESVPLPILKVRWHLAGFCVE